jgi:hemolysin activation/secretion protein
MRSLVATARWSTQELFEGRGDEAQSFLLGSLYGTARVPDDGWRAEASFEVASPDLGGDFDFRRLIANVRARRVLTSRFAVAGRVLLGLTGGEPPPQRRFALGGLGTLRGRHFKEFPGDNMVLATAEWTLRSTWPWPAPVLFYDGGTVWGAGAAELGWKSDVGVGLEWRAGSVVGLRLDGAVPIAREAGRAAFRLTLRLTAPF